MAIPEMTDDLEIIEKLNDRPNQGNALSSAELKALFDKGPKLIKQFINGVLVPALNKLDIAAGFKGGHSELTGRDSANQHPMSAITGLIDALGKKAAGQHTHNANEVNEGVLSTDRIPVVPLTKGGHGGANRREGFKNLAYLGDNPVTVATDTPSSWVALGSGFAGISTVCTVNQPDTHGSIFSLVVSDYNVQQIFICLNGELLYRGGNPEYGWFPWRSVMTKDGGVFAGPVTMNGIHLTPGVDYGTEFPADAEEGRLFRIKVGVDNG